MIELFSATTASKAEDTLFGRSAAQYPLNMFMAGMALNNKEPLARLYNSRIKETDCDYLVLCHDDVSLEDNNLKEKLIRAIGAESPYSVCGVAGNKTCKISGKNLWHIMSDGEQPTLSGIVPHYVKDSEELRTAASFGVTPARVMLLDGVFLAINVKEVREAGVLFDEDNPAGYHFYDLDFCLSANKAGLKMTTYPIWLTHASHGLSSWDDGGWNAGNGYFIKKWK